MNKNFTTIKQLTFILLMSLLSTVAFAQNDIHFGKNDAAYSERLNATSLHARHDKNDMQQPAFPSNPFQQPQKNIKQQKSDKWFEPDTVWIMKVDNPDSRQIYSHNAQGYNTNCLYQYWINNAWVNDQQSTCIYDAQGNLSYYLVQYWENDAWVYYEQIICTHDAQENQTNYLSQLWKNNVWVNIYQSTSTYDAQGNQTNCLEQLCINNAWVNDCQWTYTYDAQGNQTNYLYQYWLNNAWVNSFQCTYTYDEYGNCILGESFEWDGTAWIIYDGNNFLYYNNMQSYLICYEGYEIRASYTETANPHIGINEVADNSNFSLYPNPAKSSFIIKGAEMQRVEVYSLAGQKILEKATSSPESETIITSNWESGVYLLRIITASGNSETKRVVVVE